MTGIRHGRFASTLGELLIVADGEAIAGVYFDDHSKPPSLEILGINLGTEPDDAILVHAAAQLREYLAGARHEFELELHPEGSEFEQRVWRMLCDIAYGETVTYGSLAKELGSNHLAQRVGQAMGRNPVMIAIPCHRVVGADGSLTGYAGGLDRKRFLLALEEPSAATAGRLF